jgi:hypothetical protein
VNLLGSSIDATVTRPSGSDHARLVLRAAAACAQEAPYPTEAPPWRIRSAGRVVTMSLSPWRWPTMSDAHRRAALISGGAALLNARVIVAHADLCVIVDRFPDGLWSPIFARIGARWPESSEELRPDHGLALLETFIDSTEADGGSSEQTELPRPPAASLAGMAIAEDVVLVQLNRPEQRRRVVELQRHARWLALGSAALVPAQRRAHSVHTLLLLGTATDDPMAWLRAGEALQRVRLELARRGHATRLLNEIVTVPAARSDLRRGLGLHFHPQAVVAVGGQRA